MTVGSQWPGTSQTVSPSVGQRAGRAGARTQDAVLVAAVGEVEVALPDARQPGVDRMRLVAGIDDRVRDAAAHHLALDEQRVLEARRGRRGSLSA